MARIPRKSMTDDERYRRAVSRRRKAAHVLTHCACGHRRELHYDGRCPRGCSTCDMKKDF